MKRFLFAGLLLICLTLCSCSRKKTAEQEAAVPVQIEQSAEDPIPEEIYIEENEPQEYQTLDYLEDESNYSSPVIQNTPEEHEVEPVEKRLTDAYNRLKAMEYGTEKFLPVKNGDSSILIHYSNKNAVRLFYDELFRLVKKEYWKMDSVEDAKITGTEEYYYNEDSKKPYEKKIQTESAVFVSNFNENGLIIRTEKFVDNKSCSVTEIIYDSKDRITSEVVTEGGIVKKQLFNYTVTDQAELNDQDPVPPDYKYYENDMLITTTAYVKKGFYSTTIWFDKENCVKADYENFVKVREVYYTNGVERRVKNYE